MNNSHHPLQKLERERSGGKFGWENTKIHDFRSPPRLLRPASLRLSKAKADKRDLGRVFTRLN
jgi:hypothetical protein